MSRGKFDKPIGIFGIILEIFSAFYYIKSFKNLFADDLKFTFNKTLDLLRSNWENKIPEKSFLRWQVYSFI